MEQFTMKLTEMGMDVMQIKDFIEDKGLFEENPETILDHLNNPHYLNVLKQGFLPAPNPHLGGYNYVPQGGAPMQMNP